jgi:hypothetical protein
LKHKWDQSTSLKDFTKQCLSSENMTNMLPEDKVENTSRIEHYLESDTAEDDEEFSVKTLT